MYNVVSAYLERFNGEEVVGHMCVLSPYQKNCRIMQLLFTKVFLQFCRVTTDNRTLDNCVQSGSYC